MKEIHTSPVSYKYIIAHSQLARLLQALSGLGLQSLF